MSLMIVRGLLEICPVGFRKAAAPALARRGFQN
jgi:hypothetical protein